MSIASGVINAAEAWIEHFSGLRPRKFVRLVRQLEREGAALRVGGLPRRSRQAMVVRVRYLQHDESEPVVLTFLNP